MNKRTIVLKILPKDTKQACRKALDIYLKDINDAINANSGDYQFLEDVRKAFVFGQMHIETLQAKIAYPDTMRSEVNQ